MSKPDPPSLRGTYRTPRVRVGAVLRCEGRGCDVIVTGYTAGPIRWPVGRRRDGERGVSGPIVFGSLADAVRAETVLAVARAWGVTRQLVAKWRRTLGVGPSAEVWARLSDAARKRTRARGRLPKGPPWTRAEDAAALTLTPPDAARETGRPITAVYSRRRALRERGKYPVQGRARPRQRNDGNGCSPWQTSSHRHCPASGCTARQTPAETLAPFARTGRMHAHAEIIHGSRLRHG